MVITDKQSWVCSAVCETVWSYSGAYASQADTDSLLIVAFLLFSFSSLTICFQLSLLSAHPCLPGVLSSFISVCWSGPQHCSGSVSHFRFDLWPLTPNPVPIAPFPRPAPSFIGRSPLKFGGLITVLEEPWQNLSRPAIVRGTVMRRH